MDNDKTSQLFLSLIYSFQMQTWMHLGKLKNPVSDKVERDLQAAQMSIDMIEMLKDKTINNVSSEEQKFIEQILADLKLNYVEESAKKEELKEEKKEQPEEKTEEESKEEK
jgi:hypothetical protein